MISAFLLKLLSGKLVISYSLIFSPCLLSTIWVSLCFFLYFCKILISFFLVIKLDLLWLWTSPFPSCRHLKIIVKNCSWFFSTPSFWSMQCITTATKKKRLNSQSFQIILPVCLWRSWWFLASLLIIKNYGHAKNLLMQVAWGVAKSLLVPSISKKLDLVSLVVCQIHIPTCSPLYLHANWNISCSLCRFVIHFILWW